MKPVVPTGTPVGGAGAWSVPEGFSSAGKETTNDGALLPTVPADRRTATLVRPHQAAGKGDVDDAARLLRGTDVNRDVAERPCPHHLVPDEVDDGTGRVIEVATP